MRKALLFLAIPALVAAPPKAQVDKPGTQDHALFTRMPGFYIENCKTEAFDSHRFPVKGGGLQAVEGKLTQLNYRLKKEAPKPSDLEIVRNHVQAIKAVGGELLKESRNRATLRLKKGAAETWVDIYAHGTSYRLFII